METKYSDRYFAFTTVPLKYEDKCNSYWAKLTDLFNENWLLSE